VSSATATPSSWNNLAYPLVPDVAQPDLGTYGGGFISGYFIGNGTGVLSIPSFFELGEAVNTFSETVALFLRTCKDKGMKRIVIDVQQNTGGDALLAFDTFKHFFPTLDPFGGSRMRAHKAANVMGDAITQYWNELTEDDDDYYNLAADEWMSADRINANTNRNFTSWAEFYGPHRYNGDNFTTVVCDQQQRVSLINANQPYSNDIICQATYLIWNQRKTLTNTSPFMVTVEIQRTRPNHTQPRASLSSQTAFVHLPVPCLWK
jgi:hypothetical protein